MSEAPLHLDALLDGLEKALRAEIELRGLNDPVMIGVLTGGAWVAQRLHSRLAIREPLGLLNITFYRDDFSRIGVHPQVTPSKLPFRIDGRNILLIDDVLHSGRTIRAAMNEIFDYGRPAQVVLGVLVARDGREIPIQADCSGTRLRLEHGRKIKLSGPEPLELSIKS